VANRKAIALVRGLHSAAANMLAGILAAALLASIKPDLVGGSPAEHALVADALSKIPDCWLAPDGATPPRVRICEDSLAKEWSRGDGWAGYLQTPLPESGEKPGLIWIQPSFISGWVDQPQADACGRTARRFGMYEVLAHELAHRLQYQFERKTVDEFLAIRFRALHDAVVSDPDYAKNVAAWDAGDAAAKCTAETALDEVMKRHGAPQRMWGDFHSLDGEGGEYFAYAIELMVSQPDVFCATYSDAEREFLSKAFGGCMPKFPGAPACLVPATQAQTQTGGFHH